MISTPVDGFVRAYADSGVIRAHMPGHKGMGGGPERWDITEITGADSLYGADGILRESEDNAARLFGSAVTAYSTEGSSLSIRAMLLLALRRCRRDGRPWLLAGRNAHRTLLSAAALLDFDIRWVYPKSGTLLSAEIDPADLSAALDGGGARPFAVYLTSPDYLGGMADIRAAAEICHKAGVPLLVDNAHGAYLKFLPGSLHPLDQGADLCADSAHKTLPALTGAGYLHVSARRGDISREDVKAAMSLFASTSPSYLILASLDRCNRLLERAFPERLAAFLPRMQALRERLTDAGIRLAGVEPVKLTIRAAETADGHRVQALLRGQEIECEMADPDFVTLMLSPCQEGQMDDISRRILEAARCLGGVPPREPPALPPPGERVMSVREAMLSPQETLPLAACEGRVLAADTTGCPPAVPVAVCGERLTRTSLRLCAYYGLTALRVVSI